MTNNMLKTYCRCTQITGTHRGLEDDDDEDSYDEGEEQQREQLVRHDAPAHLVQQLVRPLHIGLNLAHVLVDGLDLLRLRPQLNVGLHADLLRVVHHADHAVKRDGVLLLRLLGLFDELRGRHALHVLAVCSVAVHELRLLRHRPEPKRGRGNVQRRACSSLCREGLIGTVRMLGFFRSRRMILDACEAFARIRAPPLNSVLVSPLCSSASVTWLCPYQL
mmetsp:Transcript_39502/g.104982  ORF Transcript_39502/g.104982 Transcript_39502/m.104982 type:complete len:220 (-) Transcript_39502:321-980(-)